MKKDSVMGVTGCMAQRLGPQLLEKAKHVSLVIGPDGYRALPQLVDGARRGETRHRHERSISRSTTKTSRRAASTR